MDERERERKRYVNIAALFGIYIQANYRKSDVIVEKKWINKFRVMAI